MDSHIEVCLPYLSVNLGVTASNHLALWGIKRCPIYILPCKVKVGRLGA